MPAKGYFTPDFFKFLEELRANNHRDWFQANKDRFERSVRDPFLAFLTDLAPRMKKVSPNYLVDPRPVGGSMMRIYRDIRFSKDKSPYKTAMAAQFTHASGNESAPAFYIHLERGESGVGGGYWRPEGPVLKKVRDAIVAEPKRWQKATASQEMKSACGFLGESLKRPPAGYDPEHPFIEDLKRKDYAMSVSLTEKQVTSSDFMDAAIEGFKRTKPFMTFLAEAVGLEG